jgi:hypothetical protein
MTAFFSFIYPLVSFCKVKRRSIKEMKSLNEFKKLNPCHLEDIGLFEYKRIQLIKRSW